MLLRSACDATPMLKDLSPDRLKRLSQFIGWTAKYHESSKRGDLMKGSHLVGDVPQVSHHCARILVYLNDVALAFVIAEVPLVGKRVGFVCLNPMIIP